MFGPNSSIIFENTKETIKMFTKVPAIQILLCMIQISNLTTNIHQSKMVYGHFWSDFIPYKTTRWFGSILEFLQLVGSTPIIHPSTSPLGRGMGWLQLRKGPLALGAIVDSLKTVPTREGSWHIPPEGKAPENHGLKRAGIEDMFFFPQEGSNSSFAPAQELQLPKGN